MRWAAILLAFALGCGDEAETHELTDRGQCLGVYVCVADENIPAALEDCEAKTAARVERCLEELGC